VSDATAEHDLDLQEQIARIKRAQVESDKFQAEQRKLIMESDKFQAEQRKLMAEAAKYERERSLAPVVIAASLGAGVMAGLVSLLGRLLIH
jgi:hypothetical protein